MAGVLVIQPRLTALGLRMNDLILAAPAIAAGAYVSLVSVVALIASAHPDEKRRRDSAKILDKLLRAHDRERS
jgi:hypothetical protein